MSLKGVFSPPGDKSISHRVALMSLLARGSCRVENLSFGADVRSSLKSAELLGSSLGWHGDHLGIVGADGRIRQQARIDCGNSGTTMRLLMGILAGKPGEYVLDGDESLRRRPMERVARPLRLMGAQVECDSGTCPVIVKGGSLTGIDWDLPVASAQLKSAVLLAGIQAEGTTSVRESVPSRDHTERLLALFGARIYGSAGALSVERSWLRLPDSLFVPGDASSAAFFLCAATIFPGSDVTAEKMLLNPTRIGFLEVLQRMGVRVEIQPREHFPEAWGTVRTRYSADLSACTVTAEEIPSLVDEVPILALVATQARGATVFQGVRELRIKESDRLTAIASQLGLMGAKILVEADTLIVEGPTSLTGTADLDSFGDHRIAMTLKLAGLLTDSEPLIKGEDSSEVSYPGFGETLQGLLQ